MSTNVTATWMKTQRSRLEVTMYAPQLVKFSGCRYSRRARVDYLGVENGWAAERGLTQDDEDSSSENGSKKSVDVEKRLSTSECRITVSRSGRNKETSLKT